MVRCKFKCMSKTEFLDGSYDSQSHDTKVGKAYSYKFNVVYGDTPENKEFFKSTPSGSLEVSVVRNDVFEIGREYYLDFTPA